MSWKRHTTKTGITMRGENDGYEVKAFLTSISGFLKKKNVYMFWRKEIILITLS